MGETADQLRREVDQKRDDATQKIDQIEQQVMGKAQEIESKVSDKADQVKAQLDWRHQVEQHPLMSVGVAMVGGMVLGGIMDKGDHHESTTSHMNAQHVSHDGASRDGGVAGTIRKAARQSGLDDSLQNFAGAAFGMLGERMREMTERTFPGMLDKVQHAADTVSDAAAGATPRSTTQSTPPYADASRGNSAFG